MIEILLEDILTKIHTHNFSEPSQISEEFNRLILSEAISPKEIAFCSAKMFNSDINVFIFLHDTALSKEKRLVALRKLIYTLLVNYMTLHPNALLNYLSPISNDCLQLFKKEITQEVKENTLKPLLAMIELYKTDLLLSVIDVQGIACVLLDEIKMLKPKAGVKGMIWTILGLLSKKFPHKMAEYQAEISDVMLYNINQMMKHSKKVEIKALEGMFKAFKYMLHHHKIAPENLEELYICATSGLVIIKDVSNYKIVKQCLLLLKEHWPIFKDSIIDNESFLKEKLLLLVKHKNRKVNENACECLESLLLYIAQREPTTSHKNFVMNFVSEIKAILRRTQNTIEAMVCIRAYGILSKSISACFGQDELRNHLLLLMETSETKVMRRLEDTYEDDLEVKPENFKKLLYRQKQLNTHIVAFSHVISEVESLEEKEAKHVLKLFLLGIKSHSELFDGYKKTLYKALIGMVNSVSRHEKIFKFWIKKAIKETLQIIIEISPLTLQNGGEQASLKTSATLLQNLVQDDGLFWDQKAREMFISELLQAFIQFFEVSSLEYEEVSDMGVRLFLPASHADQHLTNRLAIIFEIILAGRSEGEEAEEEAYLEKNDVTESRMEIEDPTNSDANSGTNDNTQKNPKKINLIDCLLIDYYRRILDPIYKVVLKYPRTCSVQKMMRSLFIIAERLSPQIFTSKNEIFEILNKVYNYTFSNNRDLTDEILNDTLRTLLACPTFILQSEVNNVEFLKRTVIQALGHSHSETSSLVLDIIDCLEKLLISGKIDLKFDRQPFLKTVLPYFSSLLATDIQENYHHHLDFIPVSATLPSSTSNNNYFSGRGGPGAGRGRRSNSSSSSSYKFKFTLEKIIKFLGKLGTEAHYITSEGVSNGEELKANHGDRFMVSLPLNTRNLNMSLYKLITRASELATNSSDPELYQASCELLHATMIMLIGKCSTGDSPSEDFVPAFETALPSILSLATSQRSFSDLFLDLLMQISRWLAHNNEEEKSLVSSFLGKILDIAGQRDQSDQRKLCLECLEEFLGYTIRIHKTVDLQVRNFKLFLRKIEMLTLHPDSFRRLVGLMSIKQTLFQLVEQPSLLKELFFDLCYFFLVLLRTNDRQLDYANSKETKLYSEDIYSKLEYVLVNHSYLFLTEGNRGNSQFSSAEELAVYLQKNLFSPEPTLRTYAIRFWILITEQKKELVSTSFLQGGLSFLDGSFGDLKDDPELAINNFIAHSASFSLLLENNIIKAPHLKTSTRFKAFSSNISSLLKFDSESDTPKLFKLRNEALLQFLRFLGQLEKNGKSSLLEDLEPKGIVQRLISNTFQTANDFNVLLSKRCFSIFEIDKLEYLKSFISQHEFAFFRPNSPMFEFSSKFNFSNLEIFFEAILKLLTPTELKSQIVSEKDIKYFLNFIKNCTKKIHTRTLTRARIYLKFLLRFDAISIKDLIPYLDPFKREAEYFGGIVTKYVVQHESRHMQQSLMEEMILQAKSEPHFYSSLISLMSQISGFAATQGGALGTMIKHIEQHLDTNYISQNPQQLGNVLKVAKIAFRSSNQYPRNYSILLINGCLDYSYANNHDRESLNRGISSNTGSMIEEKQEVVEEGNTGSNIIPGSSVLGEGQDLSFPVLDFISLFFEHYKRDGLSAIYKKIRAGLDRLSTIMCPIELSDFRDQKSEQTIDEIKITSFIKKIIHLVSVSNSMEPFELIFPVLLTKTRYSSKIFQAVQKVAQDINNADSFNQQAGHLLKIFADESISDKISKNIRFNIIDRCLLILLETAKEDHLKEFFMEYYPQLFKIMIERTILDPKEKLFYIRSTASVLKIFEVCYRRIPLPTIRNEIHKRIIGEETLGNEITKKLLLLTHNLKKKRHRYFEEVQASLCPKKIEDSIENEALRLEVEMTFQEMYEQAYMCLGSVLLKTQKKSKIFVNFLLKANQSKNELLFDNLIGRDYDFNFKVETNFVIKSLNRYHFSSGELENPKIGEEESQSVKVSDTLGRYQNKKGSMRESFLSKLAEDSLFTQSYSRSGFNKDTHFQNPQNPGSQMLKEQTMPVEETVLVSTPSKEDARKDINNDAGAGSSIDGGVQGEGEDYQTLLGQGLKKDALEMDKINAFGTMRTLVRVVDFLHSLETRTGGSSTPNSNSGTPRKNNQARQQFVYPSKIELSGSQISLCQNNSFAFGDSQSQIMNNPTTTITSYIEKEMPDWMTAIYNILNSQNSSHPVKVLMIKLLLNRPQIFKPFSLKFNKFLLEYICLKNTGGTGFHYFLRDVCMTLRLWNGPKGSIEIEGPIQELRELSYQACRSLSRCIADRTKRIFILNVQLFQSLAALLRAHTLFDQQLVCKMLMFQGASQPPSTSSKTFSQSTKGAGNQFKSIQENPEKNDWLLWRLAAVAIIEISILEHIPIGSLEELLKRPEENIDFSNFETSSISATQLTLQSQIGFGMEEELQNDEIEENSNFQIFKKFNILPKEIVQGIIYNLNRRFNKMKRPASRLIGQYLNSLNKLQERGLSEYNQVSSQAIRELRLLYKQGDSSYSPCMADALASSPCLILNSELQALISSVIVSSTGLKRACMFSALQICFSRALEQPEIYQEVVQDISQTLRASLSRILRDSDKNNSTQFLLLMISISKIKTASIESLLLACLPQIGNYFSITSDPEIEHYFFDWVELVYDNFSSKPEIRNECLQYVLMGLSSNNFAIRSQFLEFMNSQDRLPNSETKRIEFILAELFNRNTEQHWLTTSSNLMLTLSNLNPARQNKIFSRSLSGYVSTGVLRIGKSKLQKSVFTQPLIPLSLASMGSQVLQSQNMKSKMLYFSKGMQLPTQSDPNQLKMMIKKRLKYAYGASIQGSQMDPENGMGSGGGDLLLSSSDIKGPQSAYSVMGEGDYGTVAGSSLTVGGQKRTVAFQGNDSYIKKKQYKKMVGVSNFMRKNKFDWTQLNQLSQNAVRITKSEFVGTTQRGKNLQDLNLENLLKYSGAKEVKTIRKYRSGELPDIEIKNSDILDPLTIIASKDPKMAQEILVATFVDIYNVLEPSDRKKSLQSLLKIIKSSKKDYQVINTIQSIIYSLSLKADDLTIDPSIITKTATGSLSYGGAALLIEEILAKTLRVEAADGKVMSQTGFSGKRGLGNAGDVVVLQKGGEYGGQFYLKVANPNTRSLVLHLIELYKDMNEQDVLKGLYRTLHAEDSFAIDILDLKMAKNTVGCLKSFDNFISDSKMNQSKLGDDFVNYLQQEKRQALYELNQWDSIVDSLKGDPKLAQDISSSEAYPQIVGSFDHFNQEDRYHYLKSMLASNSDRELNLELAASVLLLQQTTSGKQLLEEEHPYEMSLLSISQQEFDRAKFYLEKLKEKFLKSWRSVRGFQGSIAKHEIISDLLKHQELEEFLECTKHFLIEDYKALEDFNIFMSIVEEWERKRAAFGGRGRLCRTQESFRSLNDTYQSRILFLDTIECRHSDHYPQKIFQKHHIQASLGYAEGLLQLGFMDTSEKILMKTYKKIQKNFGSSEVDMSYRFAELLVSTKLQSVVRDLEFLSKIYDQGRVPMKFMEKKFRSVKRALDACLLKKGNCSPQVELKYRFLELKTKIKKLQKIRDYLGPERMEKEQNEAFINEAIEVVDTMNDNILLGGGIASQFQDAEGVKVQMLKEASGMSETVLRWFKEKANIEERPLSSYSGDISLNMMACQLIKWISEMASLGFIDHSKIILVLDLVFELGEDVAAQFKESFSQIDCWVFLNWLPQLMSYLNTKNYGAFLPLVEAMVDRYPEPCFYAIRTTIDDMAWSYDQLGDGIQKLVALFKAKYTDFKTHKAFIRAIQCMVHPDQRLKLWLDEIVSNSMNRKRLEVIRERLIEDVFPNFLENSELVNVQDGSKEKKSNEKFEDFVEGKIGEFNKKFARDNSPQVTKLFGRGFEKLTEMTKSQIEKSCQTLHVKASKYTTIEEMGYSGSFKTKLSQYSTWLSEYDINSLRKQNLRLEIPGQYSGDRKPIKSLHTLISYFIPETLVLASIRKPKRLSIFGSDEKVYHLLVKGGEDLRLDERIQQLFGLMNTSFGNDPEVSKQGHKISTFRVVPTGKYYGVMEWVQNTKPMKQLLEEELKGQQYTLMDNPAVSSRMKYMLKIARGNRDIKEAHLTLLKIQRSNLVEAFQKQAAIFPSDLLKLAIKKRAKSADHYIKIRSQILGNYAVLSIASYILGVGDRHLDNFLFNEKTGEVIPIDFGYSFGFGVGLPIPELTPFRMTQNFEELSYPLGLDGIFRNSMVHSLKALKNQRHILIDTCEVFVRDPLMDWLKMAKAKKVEGPQDSSRSQVLGEYSWFPSQKVQIVRRKLRGENPVGIMLAELAMTKHASSEHYENLKVIVKGHGSRVRSTIGSDAVLPLADQVSVLIDLATDPDILGRAWIGWNPFA